MADKPWHWSDGEAWRNDGGAPPVDDRGIQVLVLVQPDAATGGFVWCVELRAPTKPDPSVAVREAALARIAQRGDSGFLGVDGRPAAMPAMTEWVEAHLVDLRLRLIAGRPLTRALVKETVRDPLRDFFDGRQRKGVIFKYDLNVDMDEDRLAQGALNLNVDLLPVGSVEEIDFDAAPELGRDGPVHEIGRWAQGSLLRFEKEALTLRMVASDVRGPFGEFLELQKRQGVILGYDFEVDMDSDGVAAGMLTVRLTLQPAGPAEMLRLKFESPFFHSKYGMRY